MEIVINPYLLNIFKLTPRRHLLIATDAGINCRHLNYAQSDTHYAEYSQAPNVNYRC